MKMQKMLAASLLLLLAFACENQDTNESVSQKGSPTAVKLPELPGEESTSGRLAVGRYYNVSNQWMAAAWTRKGDFNGDGRWDIISLNGSAFQAYVKLSQGENASSYSSQTWSIDNQFSSVPRYTYIGDFNGDGYSDIGSAIAGTVHMKINNQSGGFNFAPWTVTNLWGAANNSVVGDFNGDGRDDIASISGASTYMKLSTGNAFQSVTWFTDGIYGGNGWTFATDYNGDGFDDLVSANGSQILIKQSTGNGFSNLTHNTSNTWGSQSYSWSGDTNNNGRGEIITAIGSTILVREYTGTSTWGAIPNVTDNIWGGDGYNWVEDFNGTDGDDVISAIGGQIYVH